MHVAGIFPDNYVYGKCTDYIWEYGEIGENNTYLRTDHVPQVYIPCRIPCSSLVQYSLNCSLITHYSNTQLQEPATSYQRYACIPPLLLPQFCCYNTPTYYTIYMYCTLTTSTFTNRCTGSAYMLCLGMEYLHRSAAHVDCNKVRGKETSKVCTRCEPRPVIRQVIH